MNARAISSAPGGIPSQNTPSPMMSSEKLAQQQRIAVDRLRQHAAQRALVVLAVDKIEAEPDRDQRHQERQHRGERQRATRPGEQFEEQERVFCDILPDLRNRPKGWDE